MTAADVLSAAADRIEQMPEHVFARGFASNAGGSVFSALFERAKELHGWTAIEALQRHLRIEQVQHWRETDRAVIVAALRTAGKDAVDPGDEVLAVRRQLAEFDATLAEAMGWGPWATGQPTAVLVTEVADRMRQLEQQIEQAGRDLAEERRQHGLTSSVAWTQKQRIDELSAQAGLPEHGKPLPYPPVTITTEDPR